jgi:GT2 family glycosyltransferase
VRHLVATDDRRSGPAHIRNRLARKTRAEWVLFLDDDDLLDADAVETILRYADRADVVYPWCRVTGNNTWTPNRLYRPDALLRAKGFIPVTCLVRRAMFLEVGGFREDLDVMEDLDLWRRLLAHGARFVCCPEVVWTYRINAAGDSRNRWAVAA